MNQSDPVKIVGGIKVKNLISHVFNSSLNYLLKVSKLSQDGSIEEGGVIKVKIWSKFWIINQINIFKASKMKQDVPAKRGGVIKVKL